MPTTLKRLLLEKLVGSSQQVFILEIEKELLKVVVKGRKKEKKEIICKPRVPTGPYLGRWFRRGRH